MAKETFKCWSCGKNTMEPAPKLGKGWLQYPKCGASHYPNPVTLGEPTLVVDTKESASYHTVYRPRKRRLPKTTAQAK